MRWLLFLSRLAFICGLFFIVSFSLLIRNWAEEDAIVSTIAIIGHVMGVILVPLVNICYLVVLFWKRDLRSFVPAWLITSNIFFLLLLAFYIYLQNAE
ncbi:MAG: hypothetical protein ACK4E0_16095 [Chitinophagaceae bacterium]